MPQTGQVQCSERMAIVSNNNSQRTTVRMVSPHKISLNESDAWIDKTTKTLHIGPRTKQLILARQELSKLKDTPQVVCVEPAHLPVEGVLVARALSRTVQKPTSQPPEVRCPSAVSDSTERLRARHGNEFYTRRGGVTKVHSGRSR
jgi:hypothetical protein